MHRHKIPLISQELLGYHLGLIIKKEYKDFFYNPRVGKRPPAGWGTQMYSKKYEPNKVFKKLKIPLGITFFSVDRFSNSSFKTYLLEVIKKDKDVMVVFDHGKLSGTNKQGGHACIVDKVSLVKNEIRLIDPSANQPKWRTVKIQKLKKAMEFHGGARSGGFWEFNKR